MINFIQVNPSDRPDLSNVLNRLRTQIQSIPANLATIHSSPSTIIPSLSAGYIPDETQASVDALTQVEKFFSKVTANPQQTKFHNQKDSLLCHSYSIMSGIRYILTELFKSNITDSLLLTNVMDTMKPGGGSSFYRMIAVFIGSISPRIFDSLFPQVRVDIDDIISVIVFLPSLWSAIY